MDAYEDDVAEVAIQARGEWARLEGAFARTRDAIVTRLLASPLPDSDLRERLYLSVQVLDAVKTALLDDIASGEIEDLAARIADAAAG
jgi:hypothetical protein